jgi:outer membrane protein assembly factor BamB
VLVDDKLILAESSGLDPDSGKVLALDAATGGVLWSESVPSLSHRANLVINGTSVLAAAGSEIVALEIETGKALWTVRIEGLSDILAMAANDSVVLASNTETLVVAVDTALQQERWRFDIRTQFPGRNAQLFGGDYGIPAVMSNTAQISLETDLSAYVYTLDLTSGSVLWFQPGSQPMPCEKAICAGGSSPSVVVAYEARTGQEIWRAEVSGGGGRPAEFVALGDQVLITCRDDLFVVTA